MGVVYLCGQVGSGMTIQEHTQDCLSRVNTLLVESGSSRKDILQAIVWLADIEDDSGMNEIWDEWIPEGYAPARACGEAKLATSTLRVEIIITAACD